MEPVLLVGETGTGKTTVCQMAAHMRGQRLHILNCNQHTETSDFLGGFRPARHALLRFTRSTRSKGDRGPADQALSVCEG